LLIANWQLRIELAIVGSLISLQIAKCGLRSAVRLLIAGRRSFADCGLTGGPALTGNRMSHPNRQSSIRDAITNRPIRNTFSNRQFAIRNSPWPK
jgi:hypothetical protein